MDRTIGIHVSIESQEAGLDTSEVGELAYDGNDQGEDKSVYKAKETSNFAGHPVAPAHRRR